MKYKPIEQQFRETATEIGGIRQNVPHLILGKNGIQTSNKNVPNYPSNICPYCKRPFDSMYPSHPIDNISHYPQQIPSTNEKDKDYSNIFNKIRNWGLWICISIVIGYAVYRLLWGFIF
jgi:hypothetical protein